MLRISHGCVINISDHSARDEWPNYPLHAASKAALESLTLSGAVALKDTGIRMNGIAPGTVLAPDSWDAERVAQATRDGEISPLDDVISILLELAHSRHRTGEIVTL
jgi:NAD(P)-dependent dehydrogenase (short-subunit alcohol dehydrogenase family)